MRPWTRAAREKQQSVPLAPTREPRPYPFDRLPVSDQYAVQKLAQVSFEGSRERAAEFSVAVQMPSN